MAFEANKEDLAKQEREDQELAAQAAFEEMDKQMQEEEQARIQKEMAIQQKELRDAFVRIALRTHGAEKSLAELGINQGEEAKENRGDWIETYRGIRFYPLDPKPEDIDIRDIAHALSLKCRFNGHCSRFYSVAEHCVRATTEMENINRLYASYPRVLLHVLLHDAGEAYLPDVPRPIKPSLTGFGEIEQRVLDCVYVAFKCSVEDCVYIPTVSIETVPMKEDVKKADLIMLATEVRDLHMNRKGDWKLPFPPSTKHIIPYSPEEAERMFLDMFARLNDGRV